jgi:hypothetical protein
MAEPFNPTGNLRGLLTGSAAGQAPAVAPVVTTGSAQVAPVLPQQPVQQETSLLDQLRQRVQRDLAPQPMTSQERLATFGRGVLSNRGSFLDNLSAGLAAQQQAEAGRREEGRKAAELEATIAERDRRAQLEKAKFAEETTPGTLSARLKEAEIASRMAQAAAAGRSNLVIVGTDVATGYAIAMDTRTGQTRVLDNVRPTRSEAAEAAAVRARIEAANKAGTEAVRIAAQTGQVRSDPGADEDKKQEIFQSAFQRTYRAMEEARPAPGARGTQQPSAPTEGGAAGRVRLPNL